MTITPFDVLTAVGTALGVAAGVASLVKSVRGVGGTVGHETLVGIVRDVRARWQDEPIFMSRAARRTPLDLQVLTGEGPCELLAVASQSRTVVIEDGRGTGKSSVLRNTGRVLASKLTEPDVHVDIAAWWSRVEIPLHVYLARWNDKGSFEVFLQREFQAQHRTTPRIAALVVRRAARLHLLLDGYDEVRSAGVNRLLDDQKRARLAEAIRAFRLDHDGVRVLVAAVPLTDTPPPTRRGLWRRLRRKPAPALSSLARIDDGRPVEWVRVRRPSDEQLREFADSAPHLRGSLLGALLRPGRSPATPLEVDLICHALENPHLAGEVNARTASAEGTDVEADVPWRIGDLVTRYVDDALCRASAPAVATARWLATQMRERGDSAVFRPAELDPFWLPRARDRALAFALMGCLVALVPSLVATAVAGALGATWWTCALVFLASVALGANYAWAQHFVYGGLNRRRPQAVTGRSFSYGRLVLELASNGPAVARESATRVGYGMLGGLVFAGLRLLRDEVPSSLLGNGLAVVCGVFVLYLATVVGGGSLGQFVAAAVIGTLAGLGSGPWWLFAVATGLPVGLLSAAVFYGAELGEVASVVGARETGGADGTYAGQDDGIDRPGRALARNVLVQARYEFVQWSVFGSCYGLLEALLFRDASWLGVALLTVGGAAFMYGVVGGAFPLLLYATTHWRLRATHVLDRSLGASLGETVRTGLLQRESFAQGVRFVHPLVAEAVAETAQRGRGGHP